MRVVGGVAQLRNCKENDNLRISIGERCAMPRLRNRRRERFAIEIAAMTPLARAYTEAGFKGGPCARPNASKLCRDPQVAARINELRDEFKERAEIHAEYLQRLLLPLAEANIVDFYEKGPDGKPCWRAVSDLPRELASAIAAVEYDENGVVKALTFHNKISAATTLLRSVGGLVDRAEVSGTKTGCRSLNE
jgi:hypothetical protein